MKRFLSLLLALLLCLPAGMTAGAETSLPYAADTVISVQQLTSAQRALVKYLYQPVLDGEEKISLPEGTRYSDVGPAMRCLMLEYPEMFHLGRTYTITYWQNEPDIATAVTPTYRMDAATARRLRSQLYSEARYLVMTNGTAVGLHSALLERVTYGGSDDMRHTAVGALLYGVATCEGYAQALCLLYRMAGIPCGLVTGQALSTGSDTYERHSWNIVYMGEYSLIDATWNDQENLGNTYWYFGLSTAQMGVDHIPDDDMDMPYCTDAVSWHRRTGRYAGSMEDAFRSMQNLVLTGEPVNLYCTSAGLYRSITADFGAFVDAYNEWCPDGCEFYGRYTYASNDARQCFIIFRTQ